MLVNWKKYPRMFSTGQYEGGQATIQDSSQKRGEKRRFQVLSAFWGLQSWKDEGVRLGEVARLMGGEGKRRGRVVEAETFTRTC